MTAAGRFDRVYQVSPQSDPLYPFHLGKVHREFWQGGGKCRGRVGMQSKAGGHGVRRCRGPDRRSCPTRDAFGQRPPYRVGPATRASTLCTNTHLYGPVRQLKKHRSTKTHLEPSGEASNIWAVMQKLWLHSPPRRLVLAGAA